MRRSKKGAPDGPEDGSGRSLYLILAGLVAAGAVGWWRWLRSVRKY